MRTKQVLTVLVPLQLAAAAAQPTPSLPLVEVGGRAAAGAFCSDGIDSGADAGMCVLVDGYPAGSGADLLMASRFKGYRFKTASPAYSTDANVVGMMADLVLQTTQKAWRLDAFKELDGTAQLDLFLCGDPGCRTVADLMYILPDTQRASAADTTLAFAYSRLLHTLAAIPTRYIDPATITNALVPTTLGAAAGIGNERLRTASSQHVVGWVPGGGAPSFVSNYPVMLTFASLVRLLSTGSDTSGNGDWDNIRAGSYVDSRGACVMVLTPVHPWFDAMGWGDAEDCKPSEVYVFDSYFPQAYLDWATLDNIKPPADSPHPASWKGSDYSLELLPPAQVDAAAWNTAPPSLIAANFGRTVCCDRVSFRNTVTSEARSHSCTFDHQAFCSADPPRHAQFDFPTEADQARVLQVGDAIFVAWALTEAPESKDGKGNVIFTDPRMADVDPSDAFADYPQYDTSTSWAVQMLTKLAVLATWEGALPWCDPTYNNVGAHGTPENSAPARAHVLVAGALLPLEDCETLWKQQGWGPTGKRAKAVPAITGSAILDTIAQPSWANVTLDTGTIFPISTGTGFAAYPPITASAVRAAIGTAAAAAASQFSMFMESELATSEYTLTVGGAIIAMSLTLVAIVSTYVARSDLMGFFLRVRLGHMVAKVLCMLVTAFAILTYPATVLITDADARSTNPDGEGSSVQWVHADAAGFGTYKVVASMSMTSTSVYDPAAYALVWLNLALAAVGAAAICLSYARTIFDRRGRSASDAAVDEPTPTELGYPMETDRLPSQQWRKRRHGGAAPSPAIVSVSAASGGSVDKPPAARGSEPLGSTPCRAGSGSTDPESGPNN